MLSGKFYFQILDEFCGGMSDLQHGSDLSSWQHTYTHYPGGTLWLSWVTGQEPRGYEGFSLVISAILNNGGKRVMRDIPCVCSGL